MEKPQCVDLTAKLKLPNWKPNKVRTNHKHNKKWHTNFWRAKGTRVCSWEGCSPKRSAKRIGYQVQDGRESNQFGRTTSYQNRICVEDSPRQEGFDNKNCDEKISKRYGEECRREGEIFHQLTCSRVSWKNKHLNKELFRRCYCHK